MTRTITAHKVNPVNDLITIEVMDTPGPGGANHFYNLEWPVAFGTEAIDIPFQCGPIQESGVNGVTHEALLAVVADRLKSFQAGPYACRENSLALTKIEEAMHWMHHRTITRMQRGVEGTSSV